jgi:precorrin-3B synthase
MTAPMRRGACPRLVAPMPTGDGLLARLAPLGSVGLDASAGLCAAARRHGNGILEITRRGSIQIRGLTAASAPRLADDIATLHIDMADGVPIITGPLSGLDPAEVADGNDLAATLRDAFAGGHAGLSPKISVVIDGGGALDLDSLAADVRLRAMPDRGAMVWHVAVGGTAAQSHALGAIAPGHVVDVVTRLLGSIAARGPAARGADLADADPRRALADVVVDAPVPPRRQPADPIGIRAMRHGCVALGLALPFGHSRAAELERLIDAARDAGASGVRASPGRALLFIGLTPGAADSLRTTAGHLGFVVRPDDPRRFVAACAGAPICGSGKIPAREIAPLVAAIVAPTLDGSVTVHISGCAKGCAHSGSASLTLVGTDDGCGLAIDGSAHNRPATVVPTDALPVVLRRLAAAASRARRPGETSAAVLARVGATIVAEARHG